MTRLLRKQVASLPDVVCHTMAMQWALQRPIGTVLLIHRASLALSATLSSIRDNRADYRLGTLLKAMIYLYII